MRAVDQWSLIERELPDGWDEARLSFFADDAGASSQAAAVLGPLGPGRTTTVETRVCMPADPGEYLLAIALVQEAFAWFDALRPELQVRVKAVAT